MWRPNINIQSTSGSSVWSTVGVTHYELTNHLGNVLATISDKKLGHDDGNGGVDYYEAEVLSATDYYPFGMQMPGRSWSSSTYRYGFNGKENDDEVKGSGNQIDFGARIYDPRAGRFLSIDPKAADATGWSPYNSMWDNPILNIDPDGAWVGPTGDYYNYDGRYLGSDGINDKKFYMVNSIDPATASKGMSSSDLLALRDNDFHSGSTDPVATLLPITHSQFQTISNIVKHEGVTNEANEYLWIAHTANNAANLCIVN